MSKINLLPWRKELREARKRQFLSVLGLTATLAIGSVGLGHLYFEKLITNQANRNAFVEQEIKALDQKITQIKELEKEKNSLIARMHAIETLQTSRPIIVHLFDELVTSMPDGIYLNEIAQKGETLTISGAAQSNSRVSNFMRNLEASEWLTGATLEVIENKEKKKGRMNQFTLRINQIPVQLEDEDDNSGEIES